jgi:hypothetical protein
MFGTKEFDEHLNKASKEELVMFLHNLRYFALFIGILVILLLGIILTAVVIMILE